MLFSNLLLQVAQRSIVILRERLLYKVWQVVCLSNAFNGVFSIKNEEASRVSGIKRFATIIITTTTNKMKGKENTEKYGTDGSNVRGSLKAEDGIFDEEVTEE